MTCLNIMPSVSKSMSINCVAAFDDKASSNSGKIKGVVEFHSCNPGDLTLVRIRLSGFNPNTVHGIHVHTCGDLTQGCTSACDHFKDSDPKHQIHGSIFLPPGQREYRHVGDLCSNIQADSNGVVNLVYVDELVKLSGRDSIVGRMVVIHKDPDDLGRYRNENTPRGRESAITGNAGARIACAVIGLTNRDLHPTAAELAKLSFPADIHA